MSKHAVCDAFSFLEVIYPFSPSLWTLSMWVPRFILWGDQTWVAYSRSGNTIYLLSGVLCFRGAYGIIFTFFCTYMVENQQNNLLPRPDNTISYQYWSQYRYSDISLFIFKTNIACFCITDAVYWFIAQHYSGTDLSSWSWICVKLCSDFLVFGFVQLEVHLWRCLQCATQQSRFHVSSTCSSLVMRVLKIHVFKMVRTWIALTLMEELGYAFDWLFAVNSCCICSTYLL